MSMTFTHWAPVVVLLAASGCSLVQGSGRVVSEDRAFASFHSMSMPGIADVSVVRGPGSISVTTDDNLLKYVTTVVQNDTLIVDEQSGVTNVMLNPTHGIKVVVSTPDAPKDVSLSGTGSFTWNDPVALTVDTLGLHVSGTGSIHSAIAVTSLNAGISGTGSIGLSGTATNGTFDLSGTGGLQAFDLQLTTAKVTVSGTGSAEVKVSDALNADVSGTGSVRYRGSPTVTKQVSGTGSVIDAN